MTSSTPANSSAATAPTRTFAALVGVASLAVLLQGLWAGLFMSTPDTDPEKTPWLEVHSWCGKAAIGFALLATVWAFLKLRERTDLTFGALALTVLLILEAYLGGLIVDEGKDVMAAVHVPLAMALMGLAVWLPLRARKR
ncbi:MULTISPECIES: hypothetical protein [Dermacoccus]|jgi:heme A synthase|uniref:Uncharacterized protein n=2 Tax=Dermacoccus TaxID=57495 RepID=A0A075JCD3_9MICO|nr:MULTISPECIES: hypothetical protein [Dermacoccus]AIF39936.1 hypothetical protein HX89_01900 [Dermacoccus nishinomiyaensis]